MPSYNDYSISGYGRMIADQRRTGPFVEALRAAIGPESVFLDIGTGTGFFAFLACQLGAARVYAVEADGAALEVAKRCARDTPGSERITWLHGLTTQLDLPERADIIMGDLHGTLPFFKGNIESMADARKRHLKPGGRMIPARDVLHAVPAQAAEEYGPTETPWRRNDYGIDLSAALPHVINRWNRARSEPAKPENLLSSPRRWGVVDYTRDDDASLDETLEWTIERAGTLHGLYVWFDGDLGNGIGYSNAPQLPELVYGRAFFPLERALDVVPGDKLETVLSVRNVKGDYVYRWKSRITATDGSPKASFDQSTFKATLIDRASLHKAGADYTPALTLDGQVVHAALQEMAKGHALKAIAESLANSFPQKFATTDLALAEVARLSQKYG